MNYSFKTHWLKALPNLMLSGLIFLSSCQSEEENVNPITSSTVESSLHTHVDFLVSTTGFTKEDIEFSNETQTFYINHDILISKESVEEYMQREGNLHTAREEQYRYTYLVGQNRIKNVRYFIKSGVPTGWKQAVKKAVNKWNGITNTKVHMSVVTNAANADVIVNSIKEEGANWVARATLPSADHKSGAMLTINRAFNSMGAPSKLFAMVHEMGHNIGFLHTDQTDGKHIVGTPQKDPNSVMNSFVLPWNGFTTGDKKAVRKLYPM